MPLSRMPIPALANRVAALKLIPSKRWHHFWSRRSSHPNSSRYAVHPIRKRCFRSRCQKAAPDHSPTALQV
jgi:hypothetical protein